VNSRLTSLKIVLPSLLLLTCGGISWAIIAWHPPAKPQSITPNIPHVTVVHVQPQTLKLNVQSQGIVMPREEIDLVAETSGKVKRIHPALVTGGFFSRNDTLLSMDGRDYDYAKIVAQAQVAEAKRVLIAEQAQVEQAYSEWQALGQGQATDLTLRKPQLAEAQAKLLAANAELAKAQLNRSRCEIKAPFSGRVLNKQVGLGQYITGGTVVAKIYASDIAEIRLPISAEQLAFLHIPLAPTQSKDYPWPKVRLYTEIAGQTYDWQGRIVRSEAAVETSSGQWYLIAAVTDPFRQVALRLPLLKGLFVQAEIEGKSLSNIYRLPRTALSPMQTLKLVDKRQDLEIRQVEVLRTEADSVIIKSGLNPDERVIVSDLPVPVEGMKVVVTDE
jgi:RND family efflux transporter MFP subunit